MTESTPRLILAADADESALRRIKSLLSGEPYAVVAAHDGREAWRALKESGHFFSAAVVALDLPGFDGLELMRMAKADPYLRRVQVVATVAADTDRDARAECFAAGAVACLPKPFTKAQLLAVVRLAAGGKG